jgi:hypothetical protein
MNWLALAPIIGKFAPTVGAMLGGPFGEIAGNIVAGVLGVESTPDAVSAAVSAAAPDTLSAKLQAAEAEAAAKWPALAQMAQAQAQVGVAEVTAVNQSITAEAAKGDGWLGKWRGIHAWELTLECPFFAGTMLWCIVTGNQVGISGFSALSGILMAYMGARFGVLGVHVWQGSQERQIALGGQTNGGGIVSAIGRVLKRQ